MAENGLLDKLSNQLVDSNKIPYVQMNKPKKAYWSTLDKALFWSVPLLIFIGIAALFLLVTQQEYFVRYNPLVQQTGENEGDSPLKWNELVFTQLWGYSSCLQFKDKRASSDVSCRYEDRASFWSIHGIWPSKAGTEGPSFCSRVQFNISQLDPIRSSLDEYWYEIDSTKQGNYFWSHEWKKHGSCAKQLNTFETELKYFNAGLDLRTKFDLFTALKNGGNIIPEKPADAEGYDVNKIEQSIKTALGTSATPYIQCLRKKGSSDSNDDADYYLLAVELCLTTDLQLIDCTHKKRLTSNLKDNALPCPKNTPIKYLDNTL
ncbi:Ribonuclease Oy [Orchesella cincta]|uniref:Ribonuclease Oy n=1 Tax=Orchesella cincta TaxID=48709 RepID=A0A1D2MQ44_ORCCI|nr:Ribonuclease Oy [Orchesella cincta]